MADEGIKDFSIGWVQMGLLLFCLTMFASIFMLNNNPLYGLSDGSDDIFNQTLTGMESNLYQLPEDSDGLLNVTAQTNPEDGYLGSRDSVATSYEFYGTASGMFTQMKVLGAYVFSGALGEMLIIVFVGMIGFIGVIWIIKLIRSGT